MQQLTRPPRDATREEKLRFLAALGAAMDAEGIGPGGRVMISSSPFGVAAKPPRQKGALDRYPASGTQRHTILCAAVKAGDGGVTRSELASSLGLPDSSTDARVLELLAGGWMVRTARTRPTPSGAEAQILMATERARARVHHELASAREG